MSISPTQFFSFTDWSDIGYNFLIGGDGRVYEGRGWPYQGGHTLCYNDIAVAMSYIGYFNDKLPTPAALQAGRDMLACAERDVSIMYCNSENHYTSGILFMVH